MLQSIYKRRDWLLFAMGLALTATIFAAGAPYSVEGGIQPEGFVSIPRALW